MLGNTGITVTAFAGIAVAALAGCSVDTTDPGPATSAALRTTEVQTTTTLAQTAVNAEEFRTAPNTYFFKSPSRNIMCGIHTEDADLGVGCQAEYAKVAPDGPQCENSATSAVAVHITATGTKRMCLNQGVFVGPPMDGTNRGGGRTLDYGSTITVGPASCTSAETGMTCTQGSHGFTLSREINRIY